MSERMPSVTCCGRPLVWFADEDLWVAQCIHCERMYSFVEPEPLIPNLYPRGFSS